MNIKKAAAIDQSLGEFNMLQEQHLLMFENSDLNGIEKMEEERFAAFAKLKQQMDLFSEDDRNNFLSIKHDNQVIKMAELDEKIKNKILKLKKELCAKILQVKQGKKALCGYKNVNCSNQLKPQVFSMNR